MKKQAIAVAVGALLAAPAAHAQIVFGNPTIGTVQLYGKLYPQIGSFKSSGATAPGPVPGGAPSTFVDSSGSTTT